MELPPEKNFNTALVNACGFDKSSICMYGIYTKAVSILCKCTKIKKCAKQRTKNIYKCATICYIFYKNIFL